MAKRNLPRDVLQRLAFGSTNDVTVQLVEFATRELAIEIQVEVHTAHAARLRDQPLRGKKRVLVVALGKIALRPIKCALYRPRLRRGLLVDVRHGFLGFLPLHYLLELLGAIGCLQGCDQVA